MLVSYFRPSRAHSGVVVHRSVGKPLSGKAIEDQLCHIAEANEREFE